MALVVMCEKHEDAHVRLCIKTKLKEIYAVKCPCIVTKNTGSELNSGFTRDFV